MYVYDRCGSIYAAYSACTSSPANNSLVLRLSLLPHNDSTYDLSSTLKKSRLVHFQHMHDEKLLWGSATIHFTQMD